MVKVKVIVKKMSALIVLLASSFENSAQESSVNKDNLDYSIAFIVSKGQGFDICNDVVTYINKYRNFYDSNPRELFSNKEGKFSKPKAISTTIERYIQVALQNISYHPIKLTGHREGWKKSISSIEEIMKQDFVVKELIVDINNDGITDRVQSYSYYNNKYKFWGHVNTVLNEKGNINLAFEKGRISTGELFHYDGRTFVYRRSGQKNKIYENFPNYIDVSRHSTIPNNMNGLLERSAICEITPTITK